MKRPLCLDGWFAVSFSLVCGLRTIYLALFALHLQVSVKEKHTASWYAKRHISGRASKYIHFRPKSAQTAMETGIYQSVCVLVDKRMNKTFEKDSAKHFWFFISFILFHGMHFSMEFNLLKFISSVYAAQIQRSTVCDAAGVFRNCHLTKAGRQ